MDPNQTNQPIARQHRKGHLLSTIKEVIFHKHEGDQRTGSVPTQQPLPQGQPFVNHTGMAAMPPSMYEGMTAFPAGQGGMPMASMMQGGQGQGMTPGWDQWQQSNTTVSRNITSEAPSMASTLPVSSLYSADPLLNVAVNSIPVVATVPSSFSAIPSSSTTLPVSTTRETTFLPSTQASTFRSTTEGLSAPSAVPVTTKATTGTSPLESQNNEEEPFPNEVSMPFTAPTKSETSPTISSPTLPTSTSKSVPSKSDGWELRSQKVEPVYGTVSERARRLDRILNEKALETRTDRLLRETAFTPSEQEMPVDTSSIPIPPPLPNVTQKVPSLLQKTKDTTVGTLVHAKDMAVDYVTAAKDSAIHAVEGVKNTTMSYVHAAEETVAHTVSAVKDTTIHSVSAAKDTTVNTLSAAKDTTVHSLAAAKDTTVNTLTAAKDTTVHTLSAAKDTTVHSFEAAKESAAHTAEVVKDTAFHTAEVVKDRAVHTAEYAKETALHTVEAAKPILEKAKHTTFETAERMKETTSQGLEKAKESTTQSFERAKEVSAPYVRKMKEKSVEYGREGAEVGKEVYQKAKGAASVYGHEGLERAKDVAVYGAYTAVQNIPLMEEYAKWAGWNALSFGWATLQIGREATQIVREIIEELIASARQQSRRPLQPQTSATSSNWVPSRSLPKNLLRRRPASVPRQAVSRPGVPASTQPAIVVGESVPMSYNEAHQRLQHMTQAALDKMSSLVASSSAANHPRETQHNLQQFAQFTVKSLWDFVNSCKSADEQEKRQLENEALQCERKIWDRLSVYLGTTPVSTPSFGTAPVQAPSGLVKVTETTIINSEEGTRRSSVEEKYPVEQPDRVISHTEA